MARSRFAGMFSPIQLSSGGVGSNAGSAASAVSTGDTFGSIRETSPKYDQIAADAMATRSAEKQAAVAAEAQVTAAAVQGKAQVKAAEKSASAQGKSGIGQIAGAAFSLIPGLG